MEITAQEAWTGRGGRPLDIPDFVLEVIERVAFEAREDKRVDKRSGVSQRLPISVLENAVSNAERRTALLGEDRIVPRVSDVYAAVPSITGKLELEYEGELQGGDTIARELIRRAAGKVLEERMGGADLGKIVAWFDQGGALKVPGDERSELCFKGFSVVPGLLDAVAEFGLSPRRRPPARRGRLRAGARGPRRPEADQPERGAGLHPGEAGAAGAGVWEGRDLVRVRRQRTVPTQGRRATRLHRRHLRSSALRSPSHHPSARARATITSVAPSKPSAPVFSTMW